jgi:hypothetical protein
MNPTEKSKKITHAQKTKVMKTIKSKLVILVAALALTTACKKEKFVQPTLTYDQAIQEANHEAIFTSWMQTGNWAVQDANSVNTQRAVLNVPGISATHLQVGKAIVFARFNEYQDPVTKVYEAVKLPFQMSFRSNGSFQNENWEAEITEGKVTISVKNATGHFVTTGGIRGQNNFRIFILMPAILQSLEIRGIPQDKIQETPYHSLCSLLNIEP